MLEWQKQLQGKRFYTFSTLDYPGNKKLKYGMEIMSLVSDALLMQCYKRSFWFSLSILGKQWLNKLKHIKEPLSNLYFLYESDKQNC